MQVSFLDTNFQVSSSLEEVSLGAQTQSLSCTHALRNRSSESRMSRGPEKREDLFKVACGGVVYDGVVSTLTAPRGKKHQGQLNLYLLLSWQMAAGTAENWCEAPHTHSQQVQDGMLASVQASPEAKCPPP